MGILQAEADRIDEYLCPKCDPESKLNLPNNSRPMGFCDGSPDDEAELRAMAENEGVHELPIKKKFLKTGREIWTLGGPS